MIKDLIPKDEEKRLRDMFTDFDEDGNGTLDRDEILKGLTSIYGYEKAISETERIFKFVDTDNSGQINFQEFKTGFV